MDKATLQKLTQTVPEAPRRLNLQAIESGRGARFRSALILLTAAPLVLMATQGTGLLTLGFTKPQARNEYKVRPDYLTGSLFTGVRQEAPEFKYF